jgi:replication factor C subunit 3/5
LESYSSNIFTPEYVTAIKTICKDIFQDQSPSKLKYLREPILKLLINGIPTDFLIHGIVKEICSQLQNEETKRQIIYWGSFYDGRAFMGSKALFHLEAMIARFMLILSENPK